MPPDGTRPYDALAMETGHIRRDLVATGLCALAVLAGCSSSASRGLEAEAGVVYRFAMRVSGPKTLDPVRGSTSYDNIAISMMYEPLLEYAYLDRQPYKLRPNLLEAMPEVSEGGRVYTFRLKKGVRFHDDPCFPGGKGRELVAADVEYSWKRMADDDNQPRGWWLLEKTIKGFDAYRDAQNAAATFDYDAPVEGLEVVDDHTLRVTLEEPVTRFLWVLAMFQTAVVPREAIQKYGARFGGHPVGTGPFVMAEEDWIVGKSMVLRRNPHYHQTFDPAIHLAAGEKVRAKKGDPLPLVDRVEVTMFTEDNPMWLEFMSGNLDWAQIPAENLAGVVHKRTKRNKRRPRKAGMTLYPVPLLDFIFRGFNMEDPLLGGYTDEKRKLRRAISLALDMGEFNDTFYNGLNLVYDGPIPPGLDGFPSKGEAPGFQYRGPDLERAKRLLAEAGYPGGKGLPEIEYWTSQGANSTEQAEMFTRQLGRIGVKLQVRYSDFGQLIEAISNRKAPFFTFAWGSDYPDAENNLALFYGPNASPGSNHFNYSRPEYDALYEKVRSMPPSAERTRIYEQMRDMVLADMPYLGSMARTRFYLSQPWTSNFRPTETFQSWPKYVAVDPARRR